MAGGNFLGRVMSYIVNEIVVEGLANNRSFQRFAVKTNKTIQELSNKAAQAKEEILEQVKEASRNSDSFKR
ncbi:UvrABC system C protein [Rhynchospora pubera]|uniref:UvrABC system C protein n=1 Tax=Rhynchospora pubera TaxID=906938 RepID=A0AAV8G8M6_9POAL|nr:UvrABC system C protein [Rhynchospora pubera]